MGKVCQSYVNQIIGNSLDSEVVFLRLMERTKNESSRWRAEKNGNPTCSREVEKRDLRLYRWERHRNMAAERRTALALASSFCLMCRAVVEQINIYVAVFQLSEKWMAVNQKIHVSF